MSPRAELPAAARCVIIGGGVGGASIAYHLAKLGYRDVVLLDRAELTSGSTFHSAGLVGQLRGSVSLTKMMMHSVERLPRARRRVRARPRLGRVRRHPARLERGADGGAAAPGGLGEDLRPAAGADLGRRGEAEVPADEHRGRPRRRLAADRRLHRPLAAHLRARRRRPPRGRPAGVPEHPGDRDRGRERTRPRGRDRGGPDRGRGGRQRRRHVRGRDRTDGRDQGAGDPVRSPVPGHPAGPRARRRRPAADPARPRPARLLPRGRRRPGDGRLRARLPAGLPPRRAGRPRRDPARLQRPAARGRLGPVRRDHRELEDPGPGDGRGQDHEADQRPGGIHAGQRVLPRRVGGARLLRRRGLLRPRARRRRRDRPGDGRVDRGGRAEPRPVGDGRAPVRLAVPLARLHPRAHARDLRDLLRHPLPQPRAIRRAPAAAHRRQRLARRARGGVRREVGLGAGQLVRVERRRR